MSEQDELLLTEFKGILKHYWGLTEGAAYEIAQEFLAQAKQHYEQVNTLIVKGTEHPEERIPLYKPKQKRLDRPELGENTYHEIREILRVVNGIRNFGFGTAYNDYVDQILALLPDIEEAKTQERERIYKEGYPEHYYPTHPKIWAESMVKKDGYVSGLSAFLKELSERWQALKENK